VKVLTESTRKCLAQAEAYGWYRQEEKSWLASSVPVHLKHGRKLANQDLAKEKEIMNAPAIWRGSCQLAHVSQPDEAL
jgi:hypothetical protein